MESVAEVPEEASGLRQPRFWIRVFFLLDRLPAKASEPCLPTFGTHTNRPTDGIGDKCVPRALILCYTDREQRTNNYKYKSAVHPQGRFYHLNLVGSWEQSLQRSYERQNAFGFGGALSELERYFCCYD